MQRHYPSVFRINALVAVIESIAAWLLAAVTLLTFISVILRYVFAWSIPDTYDMISQLLVTLIFWGLAGTGYRGEHISVDLLWGLAGPRLKRLIDIFANCVTLFAMVMLTAMVAVKVMDTRADHVLTFDLHQPVWIYYLLAWLGLAAAVILVAVRTYHLIFRPALLGPPHFPAQAD